MTHARFFSTLRLQKAVSSDDRIVRGYASVFDVVDSQRDRVRRGAFARVVKSFDAGDMMIPVFWYHGASNGVPGTEHTTIPVGKVTKMLEDDRGLYFEAYLSKTTTGNDLLVAVDDGTVSQVSIYGGLESHAMDGQIRDILEVDLTEISLCNHGVNAMTSVSKSAALDISSAMEMLTAIKATLDDIVSASHRTPADEAGDLDQWIRERFAALNDTE